MRYYYCINCGHVHDFGFDRKRGLKCQVCDKDEYICEIKKEEYDSYPKQRKLTYHSYISQ